MVVAVIASMLSLATLSGCDATPEQRPPAAPTAPTARGGTPVVAAAPASADAPTIVFIVLDTVSAGHLSGCGYSRPTSPFYDALAARDDVLSTCRAVAPASWTHPSHASFFTGEDVPEHGAHSGADAAILIHDWVHLRPLDDRLPTLAEQLAARGYQTVAVSGNPLISSPTGLSRGFETVVSAVGFTDLRGPALVSALTRTLDQDVDPTRPLFLFLNISDAHEPLPRVPADHPFIPHRAWPDARAMRAAALDHSRHAWPDQDQMQAWVTDLYDAGVHTADQTLDASLTALGDRGWLSGAHRLLITSDHGEHLGEHGRYDHGGDLYEAVTRVPLLYKASPSPSFQLWEPFPSIQAHDLLLEGRPSVRWHEPEAYAFPWPGMVAHGYPGSGSGVMAAIWRDHEKLVWEGRTIERYDLQADPGERAPTSGEGHPLAERLRTQAARAVQSDSRPVEEMDPDLVERLRAAGYLD